MREIKFRFWNNTEQKMYYPKMPIELIQPLAGDFWLEYTGLKDKNGKEIYEGDIVKFQVNIFPLEFEIKEVIFKHGEFCPIANNYEIDGFEVIGNIYENPNLLNK